MYRGNFTLEQAVAEFGKDLDSAIQDIGYWKGRKKTDNDNKDKQPHSFVMSKLSIHYNELCKKYFEFCLSLCKAGEEPSSKVRAYSTDRKDFLEGYEKMLGTFSEELQDDEFIKKQMEILEKMVDVWMNTE